MSLINLYPEIKDMSVKQLLEIRNSNTFSENSPYHQEWKTYLDLAIHMEEKEKFHQQDQRIDQQNEKIENQTKVMKQQRNIALFAIFISLVAILISILM